MDSGNGVAVDSKNGIYVTGKISGSIFGVNAGANDIFVIKCGTVQWGHQSGTIGNDAGNGIAVDLLDNIYVAGSVYGALGNNVYMGGGQTFF